MPDKLMIDPGTADLLVEAAELTHALHTKIAAEQSVKQASAGLIDHKVKLTTDELLKHHRFNPEQKDKCASLIGTHQGALDVLFNTADPGRVTDVKPIGRPAGLDKEASGGSRPDPYEASRDREREANEQYQRDLGIRQ